MTCTATGATLRVEGLCWGPRPGLKLVDSMDFAIGDCEVVELDGGVGSEDAGPA